MRAFRILAQRPERAVVALAELCEERNGEELVSAPSYHSKPPTLPPQTPYTVGNQTLRPKLEERFSPPAQFFEPGQQPSVILQPVAIRSPPEHMAPKRGKWTSPPPPEAPPADHKLFENQLGMGLQLATSSTEAREKDTASENSEGFTDEGSDVPDDDIKSVQSYTEGSPPTHSGPVRRPSWHTLHETIRPPNTLNNLLSNPSSTSSRGRFTRPPDKVEPIPPTSKAEEHARRSSSGPRPPKHHSLPPNPSGAPLVCPLPPSPVSTTSFNSRFPFPSIDPANVYYQASPLATALRAIRHVQPSSLAYPRPPSSSPGCPSDSGSHSSSPLTGLQTQTQDQTLPNSNRQIQSPSDKNNPDTITIKAPVPRDTFPSNLPPSLAGLNFRSGGGEPRTFSFGSPDTPTPATFHKNHRKDQGSLSSLHSRSDSIKGKARVSSSRKGSPRLSTSIDNFSRQGKRNSISPQQEILRPFEQQTSNHNSISTTTPLTPANRVPSPAGISPEVESHRVAALADPSVKLDTPVSFQSSRASASSSSSPAQSSNGGYSSAVSRSPSPPSPSPPPTALPKAFERERSSKVDEKMGKEEYGPIGLQASDSVSTIKAEGRGE
jgi:terminal uridylyltransferase